jgi:hypothetical protein
MRSLGECKGWQCWFVERRFSVLLVAVIAFLMMPLALQAVSLSAVWYDMLLALLVLTGVVSLCVERRQRAFALYLGIPSMVFSTAGHAISGDISPWMLFVGHLCQVSFFFGTAVVIVRSIFASRTLNFDSIAGAVCGYLFLGLGWAVTYSLIESL